MTDAPALSVDVVVIGAGPAGLSATLNLVRAKRRVAVFDANRPRNAATLRSHGFLTRDGVSPLELRKLGRLEVEQYQEASFHQVVVEHVSRIASAQPGSGWLVRGSWRGKTVEAAAAAVVIATGLRETFPALPTLRAFYGTSVHSCVECDSYEKAGQPLAFIAETADVVDRALLVGSWTDDLIVFTNGAVQLSEGERGRLSAAGIALNEEPLADLEGDRDGLSGVRLQNGTVIPRTAGFVRPEWHVDLDFVDAAIERDEQGLVRVDRAGRTGVPGLYAVGDVTPPGPEQLIVAAGHGAMTAAAVHRDLVGGLTDLRDAVE